MGVIQHSLSERHQAGDVFGYFLMFDYSVTVQMIHAWKDRDIV